MKPSLLLASFLLAPLSSWAAADPCARFPNDPPHPLLHKASFQDSAVQAALQLTREERVDITCQIKSAMLRQYSAVALKKERIGLDAEAHLNDCVLAEAKLKESTRLKFLERTRKCIAAFQDTHLSARATVNPPPVLTAVTTSLIDGKILITARYKNLMELLEAKEQIKLAEALPPGSELLEIDGVAAEDWVEELSPYISASSPAFRRIRAAESLLQRNFIYPLKNVVDLKVKTTAGEVKNVRLPWFYGKDGAADGIAELKRIGLRPAADLSWDYNETKGGWEAKGLELEGYDNGRPLFDPTTLSIYLDDDGDVGLRAGEVLVDRHHAFCYVQLLTFSTTNLRQGEKAAPFLAVIAEKLEGCEAKQLPLLLDLRQNFGGNGLFPAKLMALLTAKGQKSSGDVRGLRANSHTAWMLSLMEDAESSGARLLDSYENFEKLAESLPEALRQGKAHADLAVGADLEPALPKGFNQAIVALVTPYCISACDMTAALLKANGRATLMGSHTNGTGAGMLDLGKLNGNFSDSYQLFRFGIPATLFGVAEKAGSPSLLPYDQNKALILENRPTKADLPYETTQKDLLGNNHGWRDLAVRLLMKAEEMSGQP